MSKIFNLKYFILNTTFYQRAPHMWFWAYKTKLSKSGPASHESVTSQRYLSPKTDNLRHKIYS